MALPRNLATDEVIDETWTDAVVTNLTQMNLTGAGAPTGAGVNGDRYYDTTNGRWYAHNGVAWVRTEWVSVAGRTYFEANAAAGGIPNSALTLLTWTTEVVDSDGFGNLGTSLVIPAGLAGLYVVSMTVTMAAAAGASGLARLLFNTTPTARTYDAAFTTIGQLASPMALMPLNAADTVQAQVFQNSGAQVNVASANIKLLRIGP